ncbi:MAG TPA: hypothetical protein PKD53_31335, partial [Chloroflexaceae bacterium]|nr:hypothetical protein [Chloroflexaceae bacterium]
MTSLHRLIAIVLIWIVAGGTLVSMFSVWFLGALSAPVIVLLTEARTGLDGTALTAVHIAVFTGATLVSYRFVEAPARHTSR